MQQILRGIQWRNLFALAIVAAMAAMTFAPFMNGPVWLTPFGVVGLYAALRKFGHRFTYAPGHRAPVMTGVSASGNTMHPDGSMDMTGLPPNTIRR